MYSVTNRVARVTQPRGGYIKPSEFEVVELQSSEELNPVENVHPSTVGLVVDYLTRFVMGEPREKAFEISLEGANRAEMYGKEYAVDDAKTLLSFIEDLSDISITFACRLVSFDTWRRNPRQAVTLPHFNTITPDRQTIENIRMMVTRSVAFWERYGPITASGFGFKPNGYTALVSSGDGDFLTADTMWDFKVSKSNPTSKHTLQLLMYWIMGKHSGNKVFDNIAKIGFFNPRLNKVYLLDAAKIPHEVIETVETEVIGF